MAQPDDYTPGMSLAEPPPANDPIQAIKNLAEDLRSAKARVAFLKAKVKEVRTTLRAASRGTASPRPKPAAKKPAPKPAAV